ncbi:hypothetical protein [Cyanobium sp. CH-040]|uniref:hypothetical protein n=1 Tax=Cyanobium sp. CH-040 TaxID=2823708 RepID=UPI0020CFE83F|nr:hypothetical protein [Cyanobium sp. CH-040]MCP9927905.1 hypothetical protein [Cyanobium sp. CH-040]
MTHDQRTIVFLCHRPLKSQIRFYEQFVDLGYRVDVVVDDPNWDVTSSSDLRIVNLLDQRCHDAGFHHFNPAVRKGLYCSAWDKALFHLTHSASPFRHCWLIEDDVFLADPGALLKLDRAYPDADLLVGSARTVHHPSEAASGEDGWPWFHCVPVRQLPLPWAHGMVCAARISQRLIAAVAAFVDQHSATLERRNAARRRAAAMAARLRLPQSWVNRIGRERFPFIEFIFHTLALHHGYPVAVADELSGILWRRDWCLEEMRPDHLYHPVKAIADHPWIREQLLLQHPER